MKKVTLLIAFLFPSLLILASTDPDMKKGKPKLQSMSALEFSNDGILFIGDSRSGTVFAIDLEEKQKDSPEKPPSFTDLEKHIGDMVGAPASDILIHDMAVSPISKSIYLTVSRGRSNWTSKWELPNDLADANLLVSINTEGKIDIVSLENVKHNSASIPNPINDETEHRWKKGTKLRVDAITQMSFDNNKLYVAGLSNEEFASSMWVFDYPFKNEVKSSTIEIFHGAHGKYETHAPIRAFLPYNLGNKSHLLAAYLCTPLVTIPTDELQDKAHVKGNTVAEFGSGNYPLDMITYQNNGKDLILMSNSQLPLLILDPEDVAKYEGSITEEVQGYMAGVSYTPRSGSGVQQLDNYNDEYVIATQRMPSGKLALVPLSKSYLMK